MRVIRDGPLNTGASIQSRSPLRPQAGMATGLVGILLLAAAILRLASLGDPALWLDEAFSVFYARLDWARIIELRRAGTNPPLYHFLLSGWVRLFGDSEASVRFPSCVFGVASVWLLFGLTRRLLDTRTGLVAGGLLCISSMGIAYSQEARFYSLIEMLSIATTWALHAWLVDRQRRGLIAYIALMTVFVWTHTFAWFVFAAHGLWWLRQIATKRMEVDERRRLWRGGLTGFATVPVLFLPWVPVLLDQIRTVCEGYWIERPAPTALALCLYDFLAPSHTLRWGLALVAAGVAVWVLAGRGAWRSGWALPRRTPDLPVFLLVAWATVPILVPFLWSWVGPPIFQTKYAIVAQPAALILFAWLAVRFTVPAMIALAGVSLLAVCPSDHPRVVEQWRAAANLVTQHAPSNAPVYVYREYCCFALTYYFTEEHRVTPVYPDKQRRIDFAPYYPNPAIPLGEMIRRLENDPGEVWMVLARVRRGNDDRQFRRLLARIQTARPILARWRLRNVDVVRLGPAPADLRRGGGWQACRRRPDHCPSALNQVYVLRRVAC